MQGLSDRVNTGRDFAAGATAASRMTFGCAVVLRRQYKNLSSHIEIWYFIHT